MAAAAKASRAAFGEALLELGAKDPQHRHARRGPVEVHDDREVRQEVPRPRLQVGIAEANMIGIAAGLALAGRVPFACSFACFLIGRFETIRVSVAYSQRRSRLVGTHAGVAIGEDGYTPDGPRGHRVIRSLPNIPIVQPGDEIETGQAVAYAVDHPGPIYLRLTRQNLEPGPRRGLPLPVRPAASAPVGATT